MTKCTPILTPCRYIDRLKMETRTASSAAVSEVLNVNNYLVWKVQVRTYLIAQDLWDIVKATDECPKPEGDEVAFKAWTRKNALALHVIQISCEPRVCFVIRRISSAKIAWDTLKAICKIDKRDYDGMSLSILHVLKHFSKARKYDNKLTPKKKS